MAYYLRSADYGLMYIEYKEEVLAAITYKGWSPSKAKIEYPTAEYTFDKTNFFGTRRKIFKNGQPIGHLKIDRGIVIEMANGIDEEFDLIKLKTKGFFRNKIEVYINEEHLLTMHPKHTWVKASYDIEIVNTNSPTLPMEELLGILGYAVKYYNSMGAV